MTAVPNYTAESPTTNPSVPLPTSSEEVPPLNKQCVTEDIQTADAESALTFPPLDKQCVAEVSKTAGGEAPLLIPPLNKQCMAEDSETAGGEAPLLIPPLEMLQYGRGLINGGIKRQIQWSEAKSFTNKLKEYDNRKKLVAAILRTLRTSTKIPQKVGSESEAL